VGGGHPPLPTGSVGGLVRLHHRTGRRARRLSDEWERDDLVANLVNGLKQCDRHIQERMVWHFFMVEDELGQRVGAALSITADDVRDLPPLPHRPSPRKNSSAWRTWATTAPTRDDHRRGQESERRRAATAERHRARAIEAGVELQGGSTDSLGQRQSGIADDSVDSRRVPQQLNTAHVSVRSCQNAPSWLRSYSSGLTQASNVLPSLSRMTNRQHSGTEHTSDTGTDTGAVTMPVARQARS
jgi:Catalase-related immune-responsive